MRARFAFALLLSPLLAPALAAQVAPAPLLPLRAERAAPDASVAVERDRLAGAGYGLVIGALIGGTGFATVTAVANQDEGRDYWPLALAVGSVAGGAAGLVLGALVGAADRSELPPPRTRLIAGPAVRQQWVLGLSAPLGPRPPSGRQ